MLDIGQRSYQVSQPVEACATGCGALALLSIYCLTQCLAHLRMLSGSRAMHCWPRLTSILSSKTCRDLHDPARHLTPPSNSRLVRLYLGSIPMRSSNLACQHIQDGHTCTRTMLHTHAHLYMPPQMCLDLMRMCGCPGHVGKCAPSPTCAQTHI